VPWQITVAAHKVARHERFPSQKVAAPSDIPPHRAFQVNDLKRFLSE
jgi:hypothetical protein